MTFRLSKIILKLLTLRYSLEVKGLPKFNKKHNYLILPNHVAYIDPLLIWCLLRPQRALRPVATSSISKIPVLTPFFKLIGTISVGNTTTTDTKGIQETLNELTEALNQGDSVLLYPSGQLMGQGKEYLGGKKSAYLAVQSAPATTLMYTVRTTGLWGSMRSNAWTGNVISLFGALCKGIRFVLANFIFFIPKRKVVIEFQEQTEKLRSASKESLEHFNQILEDFYNEKGEEKVSYIPHYFYYNDVKNKQLPNRIRNSISSLQVKKHYDTTQFPTEVIQDCISLIKNIKNLDSENEITLDSNLILELYLDSLDMAELKNSILSRYPKASNTPILELKTVADIVAMALGQTANENSDFKPCIWNIAPELSQTRDWSFGEQLNILQLFKEQWKKDKNASQLYDALFGLQTRKDIVLKSLLISDYLKKIPGKQIGIMLPALGSTSILLLATYLAEKIPVMMNRTHPEVAFAHCVKFSKTEKILTSKAFFDKISIARLKDYDFVFLEDLLKNIPLQLKIKALIKSRFFPIPKSLDKTAVVLYTSGSEALPKAVPLTHQNLIADLKGALDIMHIHNDERFFCYLPPFHSFGFTVNTVFPLITGLRSVNTPDPNDSLTVAKLIAHTQPTLLATTPTFLRNLLAIASKDQLASLRYVITGGEKCSELVFEKTKKLIPTAKILEGYGITECSPIISINPIEKQKAQSVGIAIGEGEITILDLETDQPLKANQEGMIYFSGRNVFGGYQDHSIESPFLKRDGKIWYKTGDLGYLDKDGYLYITGRKKRFLKLGGEMISLPFLEALLQEKYGSSDEVNLALEGKETETGIEITLFVVDLKLSLSEVNRYLKSKGVNNLIQIDYLQPIGSIPLLGSGKIDYKVLKGMLK